MHKKNIWSIVLTLLISSCFIFTEAQAASVNVDHLSQCMAACKGNKGCVDNCVSKDTTRGLSKDILQCLAGCGLGVTSTASDATLKEQIKACCQGCLNAMH
ncbi:hypothetical protein DGG96_11700 [Legionella qingyii]|uniref:Uncharacterized protein n=1 Tax=Legionella qingyii TaxID=2184757 RepID=A0A317U3U1_9GAMM|nr:hypothetical protein [Legionella qingyii]PWY55436.1 hypothetical protein DGG96_11700 [Legionella qingyii]RUR21360.1 hypothetical protein ELY20_12735 [Legionella qingyii]RUR24584.1 hypothetical protein ELY16_11570 [Legionella qingyii]